MKWFPGRPVPQHDGFTLIGDPDSGDPVSFDCRQRVANDRQRIVPDSIGVMLDETWRWIMLLKFALGDADRACVGVEQDGARGGRALIDRENMIGPPHVASIGSTFAVQKGFSPRLRNPKAPDP